MTTPVLPTVGGDTGLWGPKVNDFLTYLSNAEDALNTLVSNAATSAAAAQTAATTAQTAATAATATSTSAASAAATADAKATQAQTDINSHKNSTSTPNPHPIYIKTINGYAPDGSGNVVLAGAAGDVEALQSQVNTIQTTVSSISSTATDADTAATAAVTAANTAVTVATTAQTTANTATSTANSALYTANSASTTATSAQAAADSANTTANTAVTTANTASTTATNAQTAANTATTTATNASSLASTTATALTTHTTASNPHRQYPLSVNGTTPDSNGDISLASSYLEPWTRPGAGVDVSVQGGGTVACPVGTTTVVPLPSGSGRRVIKTVRISAPTAGTTVSLVLNGVTVFTRTFTTAGQHPPIDCTWPLASSDTTGLQAVVTGNSAVVTPVWGDRTDATVSRFALTSSSAAGPTTLVGSGTARTFSHVWVANVGASAATATLRLGGNVIGTFTLQPGDYYSDESPLPMGSTQALTFTGDSTNALTYVVSGR